MNLVRIALTAMLTFLCVEVGHASYAYVPLKALVATSDLIVIGTLRQVTSVQQKDMTFPFLNYTGLIKVERSIIGKTPADGTCELRWSVGGPVRLAIQDRENEMGIWLLQAHSASSNYTYFTADYPDRFLPMDRLSEIQDILRSPLYDLTIEEPDNFLEGPLMAVFRIRTVQHTLGVTDYPSVVGSELILNGRCRIAFQGGDVPYRQVSHRTNDVTPLTITPDSPYSLRVDLAKLFQFTKARSYTIWWGINEADSSCRYNFYLREENYRRSTSHNKPSEATPQ